MDLILSQKLGLTQAMQTSMRLLQMNNLQLRNYIGEMMTSNPVVELEYPEIDYRPGPFDRQFRSSRVKDPSDGDEPVSKEDLMKDTLTAYDVNLISVAKIEGQMRCKAKIRYKHPEAPATVEQISDTEIRVIFDEPQRGITPGQAVVLYDGDMVIGGGTIR